MELSFEMMQAALSGKRDWRGTCLACGYKRAVSIAIGEFGTVGHCHACEQAYSERPDGKRNYRSATPIGNSYRNSACSNEPVKADETKKRLRAGRLWKQAVPIAGTLGEIYLRARGAMCDHTNMQPLRALRFLPKALHGPSGVYAPCLLAAVTRIDCPNLLGVQRIFLRDDGLGKLPGDCAKLSLGVLRGGAVRLGECGEHLALSEGLETGLSFQTATGLPVWACLSTAGLKNIKLPELPLARCVTIAADHDGPGLEAADDLAKRLYAEGREVRIVFPPEIGMDFNDLMGGSHD